MRENDFSKVLKSLKKSMKEKEQPTSPASTALESLQTERSYCTCKDSNGEEKYLYATKKESEHVVLSSKSLSLQAYPCPYEKGWHLTKG